MKVEPLKNHKKKKWIIGIAVFLVLVVGVATLTISLAKLKKVQSIPIVRGKISYQINDLEIVEINIQQEDGSYINSEVIPTSGYTLNTEKSVCKVGEEKQDVILEYENGKLNIKNISKKGNKCGLYFDIKNYECKSVACETIMANKTVAIRTDFTKVFTANTTGTMYQAEDDDGTSYYYAGAVDDNWFKFGQENGKDIYWRIIRINGNGSIRMIYAGTDPNVTIGIGTQISNDGGSTTIYQFNSSYNNNAYVGFMYTKGEVHGLGTSSNAKQQLDTWYNNNLKTNYEKYLDVNSGFCGDRTSSTSSSSAPNNTGGTGTTQTYYGAKYRLSTKSPTYKCNYKDNNGVQQDLYTTSSANKGNKALTNPIGLIAEDEVFYAGGKLNVGRADEINKSYYLYTNQYYWTMSPFRFAGGFADMFLVRSEGDLINENVDYENGIRPVISLSPDISITGKGIVTNPYMIVES